MSTSKKDRVVEFILDEIRSGRLKPGDPLPTAAELKVRFGYSITPVREAINWLKATGYVTGVPGVRVFVANPQPRIG